MSMLALPPPYGSDWDGIHISLKLKSDVVLTDSEIDYTLRQYGCHPPIVPRIISCLRHSVYQCYVQPAWILSSESRAEMRDAGIDLEILGYPAEYARCFNGSRL